MVLRASDDAWVVIYDGNFWDANNVPDGCRNELTRVSSQSGTAIKGVALGPGDSWVVVSSQNNASIYTFRSGNLPTAFYNALTNAVNNNQTITRVGLGPSGGWAMVTGFNTVTASGIPAGLFTAMTNYQKNGNTITSFAINANNNWIVTADTNLFVSGGVPTAMFNALTTLQTDASTITSVALGQSGSYAISYNRNGWYANSTRSARLGRK